MTDITWSKERPGFSLYPFFFHKERPDPQIALGESKTLHEQMREADRKKRYYHERARLYAGKLKPSTTMRDPRSNGVKWKDQGAHSRPFPPLIPNVRELAGPTLFQSDKLLNAPPMMQDHIEVVKVSDNKIYK
eukprot:gene3136-2138_t